jgi:hypothetical protein
MTNVVATITTVVARLDWAIQYSAASRLIANAAEYWITRLRG